MNSKKKKGRQKKNSGGRERCESKFEIDEADVYSSSVLSVLELTEALQKSTHKISKDSPAYAFQKHGFY